jgi:hypothetical protein
MSDLGICDCGKPATRHDAYGGTNVCAACHVPPPPDLIDDSLGYCELCTSVATYLQQPSGRPMCDTCDPEGASGGDGEAQHEESAS